MLFPCNDGIYHNCTSYEELERSVRFLRRNKVKARGDFYAKTILDFKKLFYLGYKTIWLFGDKELYFDIHEYNGLPIRDPNFICNTKKELDAAKKIFKAFDYVKEKSYKPRYVAPCQIHYNSFAKYYVITKTDRHLKDYYSFDYGIQSIIMCETVVGVPLY